MKVKKKRRKKLTRLQKFQLAEIGYIVAALKELGGRLSWVEASLSQKDKNAD